MPALRTPAALLAAAVAAAGCQSPAERPAPAAAVVFADAGAETRTWFVQPLVAGAAPRPLGLPGSLGNLQTAPAAGLAAATLGAEGRGSAELRLWKLGAETPEAGRRLAAEWAWDFSLAADGTAIAWIAGAPQRQLWVARAPNWLPVTPVLPAGASAGEPRWLDSRRLAVVLRRGETRELAVLAAPDGTVVTLHRAPAGTDLSDAVAVPGSAEVLVVESRDGDAPGRLLRLAGSGAEPRVLAEGFFQPRTLRVSPDGRHIGVVTGADAAALRRREAAFRWIGPAWPGLPTVVLGVTAAEWSADGRHLFVARQDGGRRWLEAYDARTPGFALPLGTPAAQAVSPQPWLLVP
jgi:hypothetical protein